MVALLKLSTTVGVPVTEGLVFNPDAHSKVISAGNVAQMDEDTSLIAIIWLAVDVFSAPSSKVHTLVFVLAVVNGNIVLVVLVLESEQLLVAVGVVNNTSSKIYVSFVTPIEFSCDFGTE
jgi:hypothetical protein